MKTVNAIECQKCNEIIWSRWTHDMHSCGCGAVAIDGGQDYCRILGNREDWEPKALQLEDKLFDAGTLAEDPKKGDKLEEF
jgi:hypothetical protein